MKITDIKKQQKRSARFSIYVDGKYSFSLSDWQLSQSDLRVNQEVDQESLKKLVHDSDFGKTYDRALMWLALRPRSEKEIDDYLNRKTDNEQIKSDIKQKMRDIGQINDLAFATSWVNSRRSLKNVSKRRLWQELMQKGVSKDVIEQVMQEDEVTDIDSLLVLIEKKQRQTRYKDPEKLLAYLARQGYKYDDIKTALKQMAEK